MGIAGWSEQEKIRQGAEHPLLDVLYTVLSALSQLQLSIAAGHIEIPFEEVQQKIILRK